MGVAMFKSLGILNISLQHYRDTQSHFLKEWLSNLQANACSDISFVL